MGRKFIFIAMAIVIPGGFIALGLAWISQRPAVKARMLVMWSKVRSMGRPVVAQSITRVPVSPSRCNDTQQFVALKAAA